MSADPRVLLVEDDPAVREAVAVALRGDGYVVEAAPHGSGLIDLLAFRPDLAVLDIRLPEGPDGLRLARRIRAEHDLPIIFLTALGELETRLAGFDAGGDDYLTKPFSMAELLARVRALLRRSGRLRSASIQVDDLVVDVSGRTVTLGGRAVELTHTEFEVLVVLAQRRGEVVSKDRLLSLVWDFDAYDSNLVEVHVSALRRKLEAHGPRMIHTVRGAGYVLRP